MPYYFTNLIPNILSLFLLSFILSSCCYLLIHYSNKNFFKFLHIPAAKSPSNAKLLGGVGTSVGMLATIIYVSFFNFNSNYISKGTKDQLIFSTIPIGLLTLYGYLDDKYEIRARYKLLFQSLAIASYAYFSINQLSTNHPFFFFAFSCGLGITLLNGTNLLDGLDTMSIKIGIAASLCFLYLGIDQQNVSTVFISTATIASLLSFYFFNKEPAKLYMGEIGGCVLGFIFYIQSNIFFEKAINTNSKLLSISWILMATLLPISELGISFFRRIWMKKSPFRGDRLHLHYILKSKLNLTASRTSSIIATAYLSSFAIGAIITKTMSPFFGSVTSYLIISSFYIGTCYKEWRNSKLNLHVKNLFSYFDLKTVNIINSELLTEMHLEYEDVKKTKTQKNVA